MSRDFIDTRIVSEDLNTGQFYGGIAVANAFDAA